MKQPPPSSSFREKRGLPDTPWAFSWIPSGARGWSKCLAIITVLIHITELIAIPLMQGALGYYCHESEVSDISNTELSRYGRLKCRSVFKNVPCMHTKHLMELLELDKNTTGRIFPWWELIDEDSDSSNPRENKENGVSWRKGVDHQSRIRDPTMRASLPWIENGPSHDATACVYAWTCLSKFDGQTKEPSTRNS